MRTADDLSPDELALLRRLALITDDTTYTHPGADELATRAGYRLAAFGLVEHPEHGGAAVRIPAAGRVLDASKPGTLVRQGPIDLRLALLVLACGARALGLEVVRLLDAERLDETLHEVRGLQLQITGAVGSLGVMIETDLVEPSEAVEAHLHKLGALVATGAAVQQLLKRELDAAWKAVEGRPS